MTTAPFAMIVVALAGLFVFGGFAALIVAMVARSDAAAVNRSDTPATPEQAPGDAAGGAAGPR